MNLAVKVFSVTFHRDTLEAEKGKKILEEKRIQYKLSIFEQTFSSRSCGEKEVGKTKLNQGNFPSTKKASLVDINLVYSIYFVSLCVRKIINETTFFFFLFLFNH